MGADDLAESFPAGAVLGGRWRIVTMLGEGGLATVYEAEGLEGQGRRALKILHAQFRSNRQVVERFYAEARACHELRHPNIASVDEYAYAEDGSPFIVMELLVGQSLEDHLRTHPPLPVELAAKLIVDALAALDVAHRAGVVHRDVKPPNLFVVPTPEGTPLLKVLDFGIAKVMDVAGGMGRRTRTGAMLGTPGYMSPEQIRDAKSCDARSDLWSLGVVFFEMLTHRHPYGDDDLVARAVAILRDPARSIREVAPQLGAWDGFFATALAQDPASRFQSADAMAHAVREVLAGGVVSAPLALASPVAQGGAPPRAKGGTLASYMVAAAAGDGVTHQSAAPGYGGAAGPPVQVVTAGDYEAPSVVWWAVVLIALGSFASGILLGYLLAS